jgi:hypothetical protein
MKAALRAAVSAVALLQGDAEIGRSLLAGEGRVHRSKSRLEVRD